MVEGAAEVVVVEVVAVEGEVVVAEVSYIESNGSVNCFCYLTFCLPLVLFGVFLLFLSLVVYIKRGNLKNIQREKDALSEF